MGSNSRLKHLIKLHLIVGARPNFMKMAPLYRELSLYSENYESLIIHTGQHYDEKMSKLFFNDLDMPKPAAYLNVGSGSHGKQTAMIMERYEDLLLAGDKPDLVIVAGDVNSTIACALVAKKLYIPVAHLEAGLRSYDDRMPEEINRVLTDRISDILLTPSLDANKNLEKEGIEPDKIYFVGNIMIDSLIAHKEKAETSNIFSNLNMLPKESYALVTLHRPSNVDEYNSLKMLLMALSEISGKIKIIFPMHPRTKKNIYELGLSSILNTSSNLIITEPLGYLDFLKLEMNAKFILTDSGGIQEESTYFGIPCLTLRENTERPITITEGTNQIVDLNVESIVNSATDIIEGKNKKGKIPKYWDGKTAARIVKVLDDWFDKRERATEIIE
jgi:UDP-N-acetylglucosamine 2-epimerase (non-hydrolysing)